MWGLFDVINIIIINIVLWNQYLYQTRYIDKIILLERDKIIQKYKDNFIEYYKYDSLQNNYINVIQTLKNKENKESA